MSGGKGGSRTAEQQIPAWIQAPAERNLASAEAAKAIGYMPYYGPSVAALSPQQQNAMQASNSAMQAFGLAPRGQPYSSGVPAPQTFAGGVQGYSSGDLFDQAVAELAARDPEQLAKYNKFYGS
jgi:hypothetical protein